MKDGIDPEKFAEDHKTLDFSGRVQHWSSFKQWIFLGARAQGWRGHLGIVMVAMPLFVVAISVIDGFPSLPLYLACAAVAVPGVLLTREGWRRKREWRRANPFNDKL